MRSRKQEKKPNPLNPGELINDGFPRLRINLGNFFFCLLDGNIHFTVMDNLRIIVYV